MSRTEENILFVKKFQRAFGLPTDGWAGEDTNSKLDEIANELSLSHIEWHAVKASSFADPKDVERFEACKAKGNSDAYCFRFGDNGIGAWGHNTAQDHTPMCALPRDDWKAANKRGGAEVLLRYHGGTTHRVILGDSMPWKKNITNGSGIDLNPAALKLFGMQAPILKNGFEWAWA